jgi:hypothetical protein
MRTLALASTYLRILAKIHGYSNIPTEPDLVDVSLMTEIKYSDDNEFPFKVVEAIEKLRKARRKFIDVLKEY